MVKWGRDQSSEGRLYSSVVQKWCSSVPLTPPIGQAVPLSRT